MNGLSAVKPNIYRLIVPFLDIYTTVFILRTGEGAVLFDTATYASDVDGYIVPALQELGISARELKYVVISHNHRDHAGGLERFAQLYPDTSIAAGSDRCAERVPGREVRVVRDGQTLLGALRVVAIPGHTDDCVGIVDTETKTLLSGDGLQLYGIYGSGPWGANIRLVAEHLEAGRRLKEMEIETVIACHDYHPCDYRADGRAAVARYVDECANALYAIRAFAEAHPALTDAERAERYNAQSGLPTVAPSVFAAVRTAMEQGVL